MRIVIFSGSHGRHFFLHSKIIDSFNVVGIVYMEREDVKPNPEISWNRNQKELFEMHFEKRRKVEYEYFGNFGESIFNQIPKLEVSRFELNSEKTVNFLKSIEFDVTIVFGVDIIKDPVFSLLPYWKINIHLGLSPWYKGAATLFWPFYFLEPQLSGATIHLIAPKADAGDIIHHSIPQLKSGSTLHEHSANVVIKASQDLIDILRKISAGKEIILHKQKQSGKLFMESDFRPEHLELIYTFYKDGIIDKFISGEFNHRKPKLINHNSN
jgi:methionyl-tRNA formyltransferase